jgi:murein DD-endopeptidase MepM/ murein hydrolase activator NlpD
LYLSTFARLKKHIFDLMNIQASSFLLLFSCLLSLSGVAQKKYPQDAFIAPLDIPLVLSGTFGELRGNHFHSGIDIKTNGKEGYVVRAVADGEVIRIKTSPFGFGRAVYVRHNNGYVSVYAHLQHFNKELDAYMRAAQYRDKSFEVELFPPAGMFSLKQGDTLAFSGNSGGSGGPHLHFEIRDAATEKIINPLLFGLDVADDIAPNVNSLQVYTFRDDELVGSNPLRVLRVSEGDYALSGDGIVEVNGEVAFGLNVYDLLNGASNKNGVYCISLFVDSVPMYQFKTETFAFSETRYINSHIDYPQKSCCKQVINRLYVEPGNRLSMYQQTEKMKLFAPEDDSLHQVRIEVSDAAGNQSVLRFQLRRGPHAFEEEVMEGATEANVSKFLYTQTNFFKQDEVQFVLPEGALYRDVFFEYGVEEPTPGCVGNTYKLGDIAIPIHKFYTLKIQVPPAYLRVKDKLCVVSVKDGRIADYEGSTIEGNMISARTRQLGSFALAIDDVPPILTDLNLKQGRIVKGSKLKVRAKDVLSGIKSYKATVNGTWVLMEYDAKYNLFIVDFEEAGIGKGKHEVVVEATDELGNKATLKLSVTL